MSDEPPEPGGSPTVVVNDEQEAPVDVERVRTVAERALEALGVPADAELSITLVGEERIAELKEQAFGERAVTDVLAFPLDAPGEETFGPMLLGDVVVCPAFGARQARALGIDPADELDQLVVHGILHVFGRDHATPEQELDMAREQRTLVREIAWAR